MSAAALSKWLTAISLEQPTIQQAERALRVERLTSVAKDGMRVNWWAGDNLVFGISPLDQLGPRTRLGNALMMFRSDFFKVEVNVKPVDLRPFSVNGVSLDTSPGDFARKMSAKGFVVKVSNTAGTRWEVSVEQAFAFHFHNLDGMPDIEAAPMLYMQYFYNVRATPKRASVSFSEAER